MSAAALCQPLIVTVGRAVTVTTRLRRSLCAGGSACCCRRETKRLEQFGDGQDGVGSCLPGLLDREDLPHAVFGIAALGLEGDQPEVQESGESCSNAADIGAESDCHARSAEVRGAVPIGGEGEQERDGDCVWLQSLQPVQMKKAGFDPPGRRLLHRRRPHPPSSLRIPPSHDLDPRMERWNP